MIKIRSKADTGETVEPDSQDHFIDVDLSMNKISEEETLGQEILEEKVISEEETKETPGKQQI